LVSPLTGNSFRSRAIHEA